MQIPAISSALDGMSRAEAQLNNAARDIARAPLATSPGGDLVDLSAPVLAMLESRNSFDANTKVLKVADELNKDLLNILG